TARYRAATLLLWVAFFASLLTLYFLQNWVPQLAANAGLLDTQAYWSGAILSFGLFVGNASVGWFADLFGLRRAIATYLALGAIVLLLFSYLQSTTAVLIGLGTLGIMQGGFLGLYAVGARIYPAAVRVTGSGCAARADRGRARAEAEPRVVDRRRDRAERGRLIHAVHHCDDHEEHEHRDVEHEESTDALDDGIRNDLAVDLESSHGLRMDQLVDV